MVLRLQLDDPDTLNCRTTVLPHDTGLEGNARREASLDVLGGIVAHGVWSTEVLVVDFAQRIFGIHLCHDNWWWPYVHLRRTLRHGHIKLDLVAISCIDLA